MKAKLFWNEYSMFSYEEMFGIREVERLFQVENIQKDNQYISFNIEMDADIFQYLFQRITFFFKAEYRGSVYFSNQYLIEMGYKRHKVVGNKQVTRYSVHGLHEYKGKFNPQMVHAIINILGIEANQNVLDPFCGSGTTLVECEYLNVKATGTDINRLASYIANTKINALRLNIDRIRVLKSKIIEFYSFNRINFNLEEGARVEYLLKWFNEDILKDIECIRIGISNIDSEYQDIFYVLCSNILRDYSLQEPGDLRIRKRKSELPTNRYIDAFDEAAEKFIQNMQDTNGVYNIEEVNSISYNMDIRELDIVEKFDAAITSPPYATALPYIDTQRLSLVWLGFVEANKIMELERSLIGSREMNTKMKAELQKSLSDNENNLPENIWSFCTHIQNSLGEDDGFRRRAMPILLYRYFSDMKVMFENVKNVVKDGGKFALVVGHNHTVIGGNRININTPLLLVDVAVQVGWKFNEILPIEVFKRFDLHKKNSITEESLIILTNEY